MRDYLPVLEKFNNLKDFADLIADVNTLRKKLKNTRTKTALIFFSYRKQAKSSFALCDELN